MCVSRKKIIFLGKEILLWDVEMIVSNFISDCIITLGDLLSVNKDENLKN